jgi:transposase-like protein
MIIIYNSIILILQIPHSNNSIVRRDNMSAKRIQTFKCPYCEKRFTRDKLSDHIEDKHEDMIPEGFTPLRLTYNYVNRRPLSYHGRCAICKKDTPWDENKGRYERYK